MKNSTLHKELRDAGATTKEASELSALAVELRLLGRLHAKRGFFSKTFLTASVAFISLLLLITINNSLPGTWTYSIKRVSEQAVAFVDPDYIGTMMVHRSEEVQELVAQRASDHLLTETLATYRQEANSYHEADNKIFGHCKANLEAAAGKATISERRAILATIATIPI